MLSPPRRCQVSQSRTSHGPICFCSLRFPIVLWPIGQSQREQATVSWNAIQTFLAGIIVLLQWRLRSLATPFSLCSSLMVLSLPLLSLAYGLWFSAQPHRHYVWTTILFPIAFWRPAHPSASVLTWFLRTPITGTAAYTYLYLRTTGTLCVTLTWLHEWAVAMGEIRRVFVVAACSRRSIHPPEYTRVPAGCYWAFAAIARDHTTCAVYGMNTCAVRPIQIISPDNDPRAIFEDDQLRKVEI